MKSTGIVRRIDDLGRIVIPKEIRKTLKIKENESLEVFINNDEIILKKFSNMNDLEKIVENYIKVLKDITGNNIIITDRNKVIGTSEILKNEYLNKDISENLDILLNNRKNILSNDKKELEILTDKKVQVNYYLIPIIVNSDVSGAIIMLSNKEIKEEEKLTLDIVSKIITNSLE